MYEYPIPPLDLQHVVSKKHKVVKSLDVAGYSGCRGHWQLTMQFSSISKAPNVHRRELVDIGRTDSFFANSRYSAAISFS